MTDAADSTFPRRQLGRYLREGREALGLTIVEAADLMQWGKSTLQRFERGQSDRVRVVDVRELCRIYDFDNGMTEAMVGLAQQAAVKSWWHEFGDLIPENFSVYMGLESSARVLTTYQPDLVPGLLQTADYARRLIHTAHPDARESEIAGRVQVRMRRQVLITRNTRPTALHVVLSESVLRRSIGGPTIMAAQMRHLADTSTRPNIAILVLPFAAGMPTGEQTGPFVILDFGHDNHGRSVEPTVVYAEGFTGDMYSEKVRVVDCYAAAYDRIRRAALDEADSRILLRQTAKEYSA
ncbi:helix-turn-helix domain-containing protein [Nocardia sp. 2]|uniref:Helix-turn-helix domain-containing protein n=1 Tax=Nocardia acididurans TaxID=2802282 RepID=A0ABS1MHJ4_9NOCA|nr:helix-turn-helix transcriptional regulator [Nocardia acididurans]MBL1080135.1 helix-turn-helix domain-containing protein [Nocardia acididurans]